MNEKIVLLVEDRKADVELTLEALKESKITNKVIVARDGEEALNYLFGKGEYEGRDLREMPTVVLLDLKLPKIDGFEVLQQMRANDLTKLLPVVILTSSREEQDLVEGYDLGCNSYICKPLEFEAFHEAIKNLGLYWLLLNEAPLKEGE
jgi:two-component system response regulator